MREILCVLLVISLLGFSNASFAHSNDSNRNDSNRKAMEAEFPKGTRADCGRYHITLKSGEVLKKVRACWIVDDDHVRVVQAGKVRMIARSEISDSKYIATFWEKFRERAQIAILIPATPVLLLLFYITNRGPD